MTFDAGCLNYLWLLSLGFAAGVVVGWKVAIFGLAECIKDAQDQGHALPPGWGRVVPKGGSGTAPPKGAP